MEFSRQAYWGGWPFPPPRDLPNPEIRRRSPTLQVDSLPSEAPGKPSPHRGRMTTGPRLPCHPHTASADPRIIITNTPHTPLTPIYFLFFFNWRIIAFQCCVSFHCPAAWISLMYTCILSLGASSPSCRPLHPLGRHRAGGWAPCGIRQLPSSFLFYTW